MVDSGRCNEENLLTFDECKKAAESESGWFWGLSSGNSFDTSREPYGCLYSGSGAVGFNTAKAGTDCSASYIYSCVCKGQKGKGKIIANVILILGVRDFPTPKETSNFQYNQEN